MLEPFAVISGSIASDENIKLITDVAKDRYAGYNTSHHEWIDKVEPSDYRKALDAVRTDPAIFAKMHERFPDSTIKSVSEVDEVYWAVSPKGAVGSDRSLVDCHYDSPYALIPTGGVIFYRVIIACNENNTVTTVFPDEDVRVKMGPKDFHGLDYNKDIHCVEGKIPEGKFRVLLKMHYIIIPMGGEGTESFVRWLNVSWTVFSRETMRMSTNPQNWYESIVAMIVNVFRIFFNNFYTFLLVIAAFTVGYMLLVKRGRRGGRGASRRFYFF
jgi:hypothetical protein